MTTRNLLPTVRPTLEDGTELPSLQEAELLALVTEEAAEVQQCIAKIMRHGWMSYNPTVPDSLSNIGHLEKELGQLAFTVDLLVRGVSAIDRTNVTTAYTRKAASIAQWLHFNRELVE